MKISEVWSILQTECPHCGEILEIDNSHILQSIVCEACDEEFIVGEE